jgi:CarboxypepD_reg-like domain
MKKLVIFLTSCICAGFVSAQEVTVAGKIMDASTQKPISFADVILEKAGIGTISNDDGTFILNVPAGLINDTVKITHIGYTEYVNSFSGLQALRAAIELNIAPKMLDEVVIRPLNALEITKKAFESVPQNFSGSAYAMNAFFRGNVEVDGNIIELVEALIDVKYSAYDGESAAFDLKPLKGRRMGDADSCEAFRKLHINSHLDALFFEDLVHKRRDLLLTVFADNTDMHLVDIINFDGMQVYEIEFDEKNNVSKDLFKGKMFIDSKSLAIVRVEYGQSTKGVEFDKFNAGQRNIPDSVMHYRHDGYHVTMNYRKRDSTWYLDDVVGDYYYHAMRDGSKIYPPVDSKIIIHCELFVTDIDNKSPVKTKLAGIIHKENWIFNKFKNYDPNYWEHINYIVPSRKIISVADTLSNVK